jgi:anti-anti-sigma regulatory factor
VSGNDETSASPTRFELPVQADIRLGTEIQARCRAALEGEGDVQIDCQSVERVDAAVLQCLVALAGGLRAADRRLELAEPSTAFSRSVSLLGFAGLVS